MAETACTPVLQGDWCATSTKNGTRAKIGRNHFLPIAAHFRLIQNWQKQHPCSIGWLMCHFCQKWKNQNWQKPFSTNCATFPIDPKLAETAPLIYRATDVSFLPKMEQEPIGRNHFLPIVAHFRLIQNWQKQHPCSIGWLTCHFCQNETRTKIVRNRFLPIVAHFLLIQNWQKQHPCSIGWLMCHFYQLWHISN